MKYEIVEEYEHFYLAKSKNGYYECFLKSDIISKRYKIIKDKYIIKPNDEENIEDEEES